jgi:hypothetical protein
MSPGATPPASFASRPLATKLEPKGAKWRRLYATKHPDPLGFGYGLSRFSDPTGTAFAVVYLGSSVKVAFIEVILRDRGEGRVDPVPIAYAELERFTCAEIVVREELKLVDLCGDGALRMGVPTDVVRAKDQTLARLWSEAFHAHSDRINGIFYPSRLNEERNIAIYDRALAKLSVLSTPRLVDCRGELAKIITDLDLAVV